MSVRGESLRICKRLCSGGGYADLVFRVLIVSPHLDDAVLSLGASAHAAARAGARVTILTVLAGDPESRRPAGSWDLASGYRSAGDAASGRREEDARACAIVGANPIWLPFSDDQYPRNGSDGEIRDCIAFEAIGAALVLVPGLPLVHADHRWLADLLLDGLDDGVIASYVEQPYSALEGCPPSAVDGWEVSPLPFASVDAKSRACRAYPTQLSVLPSESLSAIRIVEARHGGEPIRFRSGDRDRFESIARALWPVRKDLSSAPPAYAASQ